MNKYDILIVGHLSKDEFILHGKSRKSLGGSLYWASFPAKKLGLKVAIAPKLARRDRHLLSEFDMDRYPIDSYTTKERLFIYPLESDLDKRIIKVYSPGTPINSTELPDIEVKVTMLAGVQNTDFSMNFVKSVASREQYGDLALDAQSFVREVRDREVFYKQWRERRQILPLTKYFKCDLKEAKILTDKEPEEATKQLNEWGADEIMITSKDGIMTYVDGKYYKEILTEKDIKGRTGRGDTCFVSFIASRLQGKDPYESTRIAKEMTEAKLKQEGAVK